MSICVRPRVVLRCQHDAGPKTAAGAPCHNIITQQNMADAGANKLEKGTNLSACPPESLITRPCAHLHPKSKLIHFAKSSAAAAAAAMSCMLMSGC